MLVVFIDICEVLHCEFVPHSQTVKIRYWDVLSRLRENIRYKRLELWLAGNWILQHDNTQSALENMLVSHL